MELFDYLWLTQKVNYFMAQKQNVIAFRSNQFIDSKVKELQEKEKVSKSAAVKMIIKKGLK